MEHLRISHFRGIQQGELRGFQKLNLLMGPNNSGKSAVLEALYLLESPQPLNVAFLPFEQDPSYAQMLLSTEDQLALSIDEYGDGTRSAMKMLLMLIAVANRATPERPGLFLWEEPELFQNPRMLKKMLEELVRIIQHRPVQVFIATHSLEVMGLLLKLTEEGTLPPNDLKAYRLQLKSGVLTSSWYSRDNLLTWLQEGLDPRIWGDFYVPLRFYWPSQTEETLLA
ncbi:MAG: ATP-dependent nuclease [Myxococcota bacterium]